MSLAFSIPANAFPQVHTVTFFENASGTDSLAAFETGTSSQSLTLIQNMNPAFADAGFTFDGWNTAADGSGAAFVDGSTYSFGADIGLYAQWVAMPVVHTVTFFENASGTDSVAAFETGTSSKALTLIQNMNPAIVHAGFTFDGWNTAADGSGVALVNGSTYSFGADIGLYAQWVAMPVVHTVTFFENSNALDSVSAFASNSAPSPLTLFAAIRPNFSNPGHSFSGWNTESDGSGVMYTDGSAYSFSGDLALYAQWTASTVVHTVSFKENDSPTDSVFSVDPASAPTPLTLFGSLQPTFSNPGRTFLGWNTEANGSGTTYADGVTYSFASNISLYAQWTVAVTNTVVFNENDSTTDTLNSLMSESSLTRLTLFANLQPSFSNGSHTFSGWNTSRDGSGASYSDGAQFSFNNDLVLYAQWSLLSLDIFTFSANGGNGSVASISGSPGTILTIPSQTGLIRTGFVLTNWNTSANGLGSRYLVGEKVTISGSVHLYAQWSGHVPAALFGAVGTFKKNSSTLSAALKNQINRIAVTIKSRKYSKVDLFGYTSATGLKSLNVILSRTRARNVAAYLRNRLNDMKVHGVTVSSTGEGAIAGQSSNVYSRVEVFGV
jgi:hypothetical protein